MRNVNQWKEYAGSISADFRLVDKLGRAVERKAKKGDYFKIDIPGPGTKSGDGYDWVRIEEVVSTSAADAESFGFRVRPADLMLTRSDREVAHFYSQESTSSFVVHREKK